MKTTHIGLILAVLCLVSISSAANISSGTVTVVSPGTNVATLTLDSAPNGLSGYNITVSVTNPSVASIRSVSWPSWATIHNNSTPGSSITISAADVNGHIQAGATGTPLAYLTLTAGSYGTTNFTYSITRCDDDSGNPISPTTNGGQINSISATSKPVSANLWAGTGSGNRSSITIPASSADSWPFFISYGYESNTYAFKTTNQTGPGNKSFKIENFPLMPGRTLYYRACTNESGQWVYSQEVSMVIPALTPGPTTTYGNWTDQFINSNADPVTAVAAVWAPYQAKIGVFFFSLMIGMAFMALWQKSGSVVIPLLAFMLTGILMIPLMGPQFVKLGEAMVICAITGMLFYFFTGGN